MKERRRIADEKVQLGRRGISVKSSIPTDGDVGRSSKEAKRAKHHELELVKLESLEIQRSNMSARQAGEIIELLASIGLKLWMKEREELKREPDRPAINRMKKRDDPEAAA